MAARQCGGVLKMEEFRTGGYGLPLARALARSLHCRWANGRVIVCAEFE
jgi:hypothetical protein